MKLDEITNKAKRQGDVNPNDEFYTPNYAIYPLLLHLKSESTIWCPFDTEESNFVKIFKANGHNVICTHISNGEDFFFTEPKQEYDYIISNPPYSLKHEVFEKLFRLEKPFAMLVGVVGLFESQKRFNMFKNNDFQIMYFNKRISYFKSYSDQKPSLNPPFSSVYIASHFFPKQIMFNTINK
ncbi:MAG: sugar-phospahte nucleotidyltransferase [bacterium]|nr:sugar-phospahte nucleotidyltransferase [bacterium]